LRKSLAEGLTHLRARQWWWGLWEIVLIVVNVLGGAAATVLAGSAGANVKPVSDAVGGWAVACYCAAAAAAISMVAATLAKVLKVSERITRARECKGEFESLLVLVPSGTVQEIREQYQALVKKYSDALP